MQQSEENSDKQVRKLPFWMTILFGLAALATVLLLPLACSRFVARTHLLELASHFQLQYFIASCTCVLIFLIVKKRRWAATASISLVVSGLAVLPYWVGMNRISPDQSLLESIRVLEANVLTSNTDYSSLLRQIRTCKPDIIVLQEVDERWEVQLKLLQDEWPFTISEPRGDNFGIAVLSRIKFDKEAVVTNDITGIPSIDLTLNVEGQSIRFFFTHTLPPVSSIGFARRNEQLSTVTDYLGEHQGSLVVLGDLNVSMWSPFYSDLTDSLALRNSRYGFGILPTWPSIFPKIMQIPIDHCLISDGIEVIDCRLGEEFGSDHLPLIVDLAIHP